MILGRSVLGLDDIPFVTAVHDVRMALLGGLPVDIRYQVARDRIVFSNLPEQTEPLTAEYRYHFRTDDILVIELEQEGVGGDEKAHVLRRVPRS